MSKFTYAQASFNSGVLSPKLYGRVDIREYAQAMSVGVNALVGKHGGAYKRFGLQPITILGDNTESNLSIRSVVMFGNRTLFFVFYPSDFRVFDGDGRDVSNGFQPLGATFDPKKFSVAVFENTVIIVNNNGKLKPVYVDFVENDAGVLILDKVKSLNLGSVFSRPLSIQREDIQVSGLATASQTKLTTANDYFTPDMVGEWVQITALTRIVNGTRIATNAYYITNYVSATEVDVNAALTLPFGVDGLADLNYSGGYTLGANNTKVISEFYQSTWSDRLGWPKTVSVDEARVVFGGSDYKPATIWGSRTNDPAFFLDKRFEQGSFSWVKDGGSVVDTVSSDSFDSEYSGSINVLDPYQFTLSTRNGSEITFMESSVNFLVGTSNQEYIVSGDGQAISQRNISARPHTSNGSAPLISLTFDNATLFVGRTRQSVHMFAYNESNGSYISKEVSILNDDIISNGIEQMAWHEELGVAFMVSSGKLLSLTLNSETNTTAFTEHDIEGYVLGVAYGISEDRDYLSVLIRRNNGLIHLEKLDRNDIQFLPFALFNIKDKLSYMDGVRVLRGSEFVKLYNMDTDNDYMQYDVSQLKVRDSIIFSSNNANILDGTGLALNTEYFIVPYSNGALSGFKLAADLTSAINNLTINLTGTPLVNFFDDGGITAEIIRDNQLIPVGHFEAGSEITAFIERGTDIEEITFIHDGLPIKDLGGPVSDIVYGLTYRFHIATSPMEAGQQWGTSQLGIKRVDKASIRVYKTRSYKIGTDGINMEERLSGDIFTGRDEVAVTGSPEYDQVIHIQNDKAEPCYISGIVMRGVNNDG